MRLPSIMRPEAGARAAIIAGVAAFLWTVSPTPAAANISGAVFTTNVACNGTNINIFASKPEVYLDGGPQKLGSAGLPDGNYYVKVTAPDGTLLGYSVTASVHVTNGKFDQCYQLSAILFTKSSNYLLPGFDTTTNAGGEYKVWVTQAAPTLVDGDPVFDNSQSKTDNFKVLPSDECAGGQCESNGGSLTACKFYDFSLTDGPGEATDGVWQHATESGIQNWLMILSTNGTPLATQLTDGTGCTTFTNLVDGPYTVTEGTPNETNWFHTSSVSLDRTIEGADEFQLEFGNVCTGDGGGKTLGFWSNKNGQALFGKDGSGSPDNGAGSLALLVSLHLRNANGSDFDPVSYAQYKTWDLNGTAVNMSYMLSVQLAAMELNVYHTLVDGNALIYAPGTNSANSNGFATVNAVMAEADAALAAKGSVLAGDPQRQYYEDLKNALDNANNNKTFVQGSPCPFTFPLPQ